MRCFSFFLLLALFLSGCSKTVTPTASTSAETNKEAAGACPDYFYYYNQEKVTLRLRPQILLVGFQPDLATEAKAALLKRYPEYENISPAQPADSGPFHIIKLKPSTTCRQTLDLITKLHGQPEVRFANPVFHSPPRLGSEYLWLGLTSEILVTVKSAEQQQQITELVAQTNTRLVDTIGETTFLIEATKSATGNALDIANLFHEQPYVINSEPNFYLATREGQITSPGKR